MGTQYDPSRPRTGAYRRQSERGGLAATQLRKMRLFVRKIFIVLVHLSQLTDMPSLLLLYPREVVFGGFHTLQ